MGDLPEALAEKKTLPLPNLLQANGSVATAEKAKASIAAVEKETLPVPKGTVNSVVGAATCVEYTRGASNALLALETAVPVKRGTTLERSASTSSTSASVSSTASSQLQ